MGFYIRKSIRVGPFRFNLSKSGVGVSAGIKGIRFGAGPRGNYVHMGRGGLSYRKTIHSNSDGGAQGLNHHDLQQGNIDVEHCPLAEIDSAHITKMVDSSSADLVAEMNDKRKMVRIWPFVAILGAILTFITFKSLGVPILTFAVALVLVALTVFTSVKDSLRRTTILFFDFEPEIETLYQKLHDSFGQLSLSSSKWHVEAEGAVSDRRRNAGATSVIERTSISLEVGSPPNIKTNIPIPFFAVGKQVLYFFPDKVLILEPNGVGAVSYQNLSVLVESTRFIEDGNVPRDAKVVGSTWKYVNKKGGPDKRFKDNYELPIVLYEDLNFTSKTGLNERIEISRVGFGDSFSNAIAMLVKSV